MRDSGHAARVCDNVHRILGRNPVFWFVGRSRITDVLFEGLGIIGRESLVEHRGGDVGPPHRAMPRSLEHDIEIQRQIQAVELAHDAFGPDEALLLQKFECVAQLLVRRIEHVTENVDVFRAKSGT